MQLERSTRVRRALGHSVLFLTVSLTASMPVHSASPDARPLGVSLSPDWLYVCNQDDATISVIDIPTRRVIRTIDLQELGFSASARPHHVVVEPDGSHWYVSLIGEGLVVKLDREDRVVGTAPFETPGMMALHPTEDLLFVGRSMTAVNPPRRIAVIRRSEMSIDEIDVFFPRPHAMVLNPGTGVVYTASLGVNQIAAVDPETERAVLTDVEGPAHALMQFALSPDGSTLAMSAELSHTVFFFDIAEDPLNPRQVAAVDVEAQPFDPVFTPDGRTLWLGNKSANTITAIDAEIHEVVAVLDDPRVRQPHGAAVSADGRWVLISSTNVRPDHAMHEQADHESGDAGEPASSGAGSIVVIDAASREIEAVIDVGNNATGIAVGR